VVREGTGEMMTLCSPTEGEESLVEIQEKSVPGRETSTCKGSGAGRIRR